MQDSFSCPTIVAARFFGSTGADARRFSLVRIRILGAQCTTRARAVGAVERQTPPAGTRRVSGNSSLSDRERARKIPPCEADCQALLAIGMCPIPPPYYCTPRGKADEGGQSDARELLREEATGGWGRTASVRPQWVKIWGLATLDPSHPDSEWGEELKRRRDRGGRWIAAPVRTAPLRGSRRFRRRLQTGPKAASTRPILPSSRRTTSRPRPSNACCG